MKSKGIQAAVGGAASLWALLVIAAREGVIRGTAGTVVHVLDVATPAITALVGAAGTLVATFSHPPRKPAKR